MRVVRSYLAVTFVVFVLPLGAQEDLPEGKGKETLENTCTECHGLDKALAELRNRERWKSIATQMRSKGATMTDDELDTLVDYLYQNFGKDEVNINKAPAKEIESVLGITANEAETIVRHRESKGPFKAWTEVAQVEGIEKRKIEARKDRLAF
jgi:competence ComEA-like helix-hairpin-helix protein